MGPNGASRRVAVPIKILGREYRVRSDAEAAHLERVASYVDGVLREIQRGTPDTHDAAILAALNIASDLLALQSDREDVPRARLRALLELVESA
jgi:cell division protein ZapA (FtsZ GTPase activity inhibitor)